MKFGYRHFFIVSLIVFFLTCYFYYPFFSDDSLISLRYVQRFLEGKGLTWTDGHRVEGYSNLLWVLAVSLPGKLGMDLILAARIWGILCTVCMIGAILRYFSKQPVKKEYVFFAVGLLVTSPTLAVWAIGGLEQPMYVLLVTLAVIEVIEIVNTGSLKRGLYLSIWLGLLALTRPDGFLFTLIASSFLLALNLKSRKNLVKIALFSLFIPALFLSFQLIFRYAYYGELVPNTALVKVKVTLHHILRGGLYQLRAFAGTFILSALGLYFFYILAVVRKKTLGFYLLLNVLAWGGYVTLVGGDIFPAFRHYYVLLIFFTFSIIFGLDAIRFRFNRKWILLMIPAFILNAVIQLYIPQNYNAVEERWEFRGMQLGKALKNTFPDNTLIAVTAAGCIPYSSELPAVDMLGLNDYYIPRHPPADFGYGPLGHELGDGNYVLERNPDIIIFNTGANPVFPVGEQLLADKRFSDRYEKIHAVNKDQKHILFLNKYSKNTGINLQGNELKIPGYFFKHQTDTLSIFRNNRLVKNMTKGNAYKLTLKQILPKKWSLRSVNSKDGNPGFKSIITQENGEMKITIISQNNLLLESLVLEGKD
ncbi:MAG: glycosyltransferase family 39 protein [Chryseobacterium sp.]|jgi:hypothetical protein|uniref:glycosyltransferase family 39 protein n=1 Tax=Chryseobacterium sp. TaxID=1871047 RepID=UPI002825B9A0|nr:glycosyltransferase family 39 protein [Chryseobacterium sp.]MDR2238055.1 glycosyltransferase family 39 protein [Chryseobacterium sp.]